MESSAFRLAQLWLGSRFILGSLGHSLRLLRSTSRKTSRALLAYSVRLLVRTSNLRLFGVEVDLQHGMVDERSVSPHGSLRVVSRPDALQDAVPSFLGRLRDLGMGRAVIASIGWGQTSFPGTHGPKRPYPSSLRVARYSTGAVRGPFPF